jgi:hypothetical protein
LPIVDEDVSVLAVTNPGDIVQQFLLDIGFQILGRDGRPEDPSVGFEQFDVGEKENIAPLLARLAPRVAMGPFAFLPGQFDRAKNRRMVLLSRKGIRGLPSGLDSVAPRTMLPSRSRIKKSPFP